MFNNNNNNRNFRFKDSRFQSQVPNTMGGYRNPVMCPLPPPPQQQTSNYGSVNRRFQQQQYGNQGGNDYQHHQQQQQQQPIPSVSSYPYEEYVQPSPNRNQFQKRGYNNNYNNNYIPHHQQQRQQQQPQNMMYNNNYNNSNNYRPQQMMNNQRYPPSYCQAGLPQKPVPQPSPTGSLAQTSSNSTVKLRKKHGKLRLITGYNKRIDLANNPNFPWRDQGGIILENVYDCISVLVVNLGIPNLELKDLELRYRLFRVGYFKPEGIQLLPFPEEMFGKDGKASLFSEITAKVTRSTVGRVKEDTRRNRNNCNRIRTKRTVFMHNPNVSLSKEGILNIEFRLNNYDKGRTKGINHFVVDICYAGGVYKRVGYYFKKDNRKESRSHIMHRLAHVDVNPIPIDCAAGSSVSLEQQQMLTMAIIDFPKSLKDEEEKKEEEEESFEVRKIMVLKKHIIRFVGIVDHHQQLLEELEEEYTQQQQQKEKKKKKEDDEEGLKKMVDEKRHEVKIFKNILLKSMMLMKKYTEKLKAKKEEEQKKQKQKQEK